jgi:hypothetical protein
MKWLKILIFNYQSVKPSVKCLNKKPRIPNFTTDPSPFFFFFSSLLNSFSSPACSGMSSSSSSSFSSLLSSTLSLLLHAQVCLLLLSYFFFLVFFISILYDFFSLLSFTCNYIKIKKKFLLFSCFFHYICFLFYF